MDPQSWIEFRTTASQVLASAPFLALVFASGAGIGAWASWAFGRLRARRDPWYDVQ